MIQNHRQNQIKTARIVLRVLGFWTESDGIYMSVAVRGLTIRRSLDFV
jgi:hypothetical protein